MCKGKQYKHSFVPDPETIAKNLSEEELEGRVAKKVEQIAEMLSVINDRASARILRNILFSGSVKVRFEENEEKEGLTIFITK